MSAFLALQGAGLVSRERERGAATEEGAAPSAGDAAAYRWKPTSLVTDDRWYDLLVTLE